MFARWSRAFPRRHGLVRPYRMHTSWKRQAQPLHSRHGRACPGHLSRQVRVKVTRTSPAMTHRERPGPRPFSLSLPLSSVSLLLSRLTLAPIGLCAVLLCAAAADAPPPEPADYRTSDYRAAVPATLNGRPALT